MPKRLRQLVLNRVDACEQGANPGAHIVLAKAKAAVEKATFEDIRDSREMRKMLSEVSQMTWDLYEAVTSTLYREDGDASEVKLSVEQFSDAVDKALSSWAKGKPVTKEARSLVRETLITKFKEAVVAKKDDDKKEPTLESQAAELARLTKTIAERDVTISALQKSAKADAADDEEDEDDEEEDEPVVKKSKKAEADEDEPVPDRVLKTLPKSVQAILKAQNVRLAKAEAEAKAAREDAASEKAEREKASFAKMAEKDVPNLVGTTEEKGNLLYTLSKKLDKDEFAAVVKMLKAGSNAAKSLLMSPIGNDADVREDGSEARVQKNDGARGELDDKAEEIRKAEPKLSREQAFSKACDQHPKLYRQLRSEKSRTRRVVEDAE